MTGHVPHLDAAAADVGVATDGRHMLGGLRAAAPDGGAHHASRPAPRVHHSGFARISHLRCSPPPPSPPPSYSQLTKDIGCGAGGEGEGTLGSSGRGELFKGRDRRSHGHGHSGRHRYRRRIAGSTTSAVAMAVPCPPPFRPSPPTPHFAPQRRARCLKPMQSSPSRALASTKSFTLALPDDSKYDRFIETTEIHPPARPPSINPGASRRPRPACCASTRRPLQVSCIDSGRRPPPTPTHPPPRGSSAAAIRENSWHASVPRLTLCLAPWQPSCCPPPHSILPTTLSRRYLP